MHPSLSTRRDQGSTLVLALFTSVAIGLVLCSFLLLTANRYKLTMRSMNWNACIPVLEAGIEDAMTHYHYNAASLATQGWVATNVAGQTVFNKTRTFTNGSYYSVSLYTNNSSGPMVYATGFVLAPLATNTYISRLVRVSFTNTPALFTKAIAAMNTIDVNGSVTIDSYDSTAGPYSAATRRANGSLATNSRTNGAIDIGNANVYGTISTGPGATVVEVGGSGSAGGTNWVDGGNRGIQPGYQNDTMNVAFVTNTAPSGSFSAATTTSVGGSNIMYLGNVTNMNSSITISDKKNPIIVTGNATLWVTGNLTVSGSGYILVMPGASLTLIAGGAVTISGGGVVNSSTQPANFSLIGLPSNTSITYSGNSGFTGTINAPQANLTISGTADAYGAAIVKSATLSSGAGFHYDESLASGSQLSVMGWTEL